MMRPASLFKSVYDVAIIGAGAAGLFCAGLAASRGKKVVLIDHSRKVAEKIRISGGGRCNFTNIHSRPENFLSRNTHFVKSALASFSVMIAPGILLICCWQNAVPIR